ncbi:MAG: hypothetical protein COX32_02220 [Candidatus Moranbacteria bacterium CG23_combo_of_CG06-09_8_20_14_all_41_28]|nr:MAG: hypothetical protein COX32_02220 [Candidatus Moranbacteria bacterium CG23_combo_of_CG06-09_8_20_14_all_41_28]
MAGIWVTDHRRGACGHWEYPDGLKTCKHCGKDLPLISFKGSKNRSGSIITALDNISKNNKVWPDMPEITPEPKALVKAFKESEMKNV